MAIDVIVTRGAGDRPWPDISSAMMVSKQVASARGAYEVDASCSNRLAVSGSCPQLDYVRRGKIVEVAEEEETWRGMTVGWELFMELVDESSYTAATKLELEREDRT